MKEGTVDTINFVLGCIKTEPYLGFYFSTMIKRTKSQELQESITDFNSFRKEIKDQKIVAKANKKPLPTVT